MNNDYIEIDIADARIGDEWTTHYSINWKPLMHDGDVITAKINRVRIRRHRRMHEIQIVGEFVEARCNGLMHELLRIDAKIERILDRLFPRIVGIEIVPCHSTNDRIATLRDKFAVAAAHGWTGVPSLDDLGELMKKVQAVWSDGFHGFDSNHVQPSDWPGGIALSDTAVPSELTNNNDGTFTVTGGVDDTVTANYGAFTATYQFTATPATINDIEIVDGP